MIDLHNEKNQLVLFFLCVVYRGEKSTVPCVGRDVNTASYLNDSSAPRSYRSDEERASHEQSIR